MGWKSTGLPTVRKQRDKWVARVDGIEAETGHMRPRQFGTYPSRRAATAAAQSTTPDDGGACDTMAWLMRRYIASKADLSVKGREQYLWACRHIEAGLGGIRLDRLDRLDVSAWLADMASGGALSRRSLEICRNVL